MNGLQPLNRPLHIFFACSWYPHTGNPANGIFIRRHAECLAREHKVTVVFARSSEAVDTVQTSVTETGNLTEVICLYPKVKMGVPLLGSLLKLRAYRQHFNAMIEERHRLCAFSLVHLNVVFPAAIPVLKFLRRHPLPLVITEHWSGYYPEDSQYKGFYMKRVTRRAVSSARAVLVISEKLKQAMQAHGLRSQYYLVNNVVDTELFKPRAADKSKDVLHILHVSSLVEKEKNISGIIEVAARLGKSQRPFTLTIIGGTSSSVGRYREIVSQKKLSDRISFLGQQSPAAIAEAMNRADVFLLLSHFEGMPVVLLEAMACGLPVVATPVGAVPAMVDYRKGVVLPGAEVGACAEVLAGFNRLDFDDVDKMHRGIEVQYGYEAVCRHITGIYRQLLAHA